MFARKIKLLTIYVLLNLFSQSYAQTPIDINQDIRDKRVLLDAARQVKDDAYKIYLKDPTSINKSILNSAKINFANALTVYAQAVAAQPQPTANTSSGPAYPIAPNTYKNTSTLYIGTGSNNFSNTIIVPNSAI